MKISYAYVRRYLRTLRQVPLTQISARIRLRGIRILEGKFPQFAGAPSRPVDLVPGWPEGFSVIGSQLPRGEAQDIVDGYLTLLGERRSILDVAKWNEASEPRLWNFTLQYFEWAWALAMHPDREQMAAEFERIWTDWNRLTHFPQGDAWAPYPVSLRLWVMCSLYEKQVRDRSFSGSFRASISQHARYLGRHLEIDLGGNHLIKNLKALIGAGVFLGDEKITSRATKLLSEQIHVQILSDGGHFERSASYHCQVLGDFIDISELMKAAKLPPIDGLDTAIQSMRKWLGSVLAPDDQLPMFNDGAAVAPAEVRILKPTDDSSSLRILGASGYVVVAPDRRTFCVIDVGDPCPRELPGHAHADCLSFELWIDARRWICDTGTSTYEAGSRRAHERSTGSHNTVMIDQVDQTEVWGAFRAGRRAHGSLLSAIEAEGSISVVATHDGYLHLDGSPTHIRSFSFSTGNLRIVDEITGLGQHDVVSMLVINPNVDGVSVRSIEPIVQTPVKRALDFGVFAPASRSEIRRLGTHLPVVLNWDLEWV